MLKKEIEEINREISLLKNNINSQNINKLKMIYYSNILKLIEQNFTLNLINYYNQSETHFAEKELAENIHDTLEVLKELNSEILIGL